MPFVFLRRCHRRSGLHGMHLNGYERAIAGRSDVRRFQLVFRRHGGEAQLNIDRQAASSVPGKAPDRSSVAKRFDAPERVLAFDQGRLELITVGGHLIGKGSCPPGWRWSQVVRVGHRPGGHVEVVGVVLSGRAKTTTAEAGEVDLMPGDFFFMTGDQEAWVVGLRPCEILYLSGTETLIDQIRSGLVKESVIPVDPLTR